MRNKIMAAVAAAAMAIGLAACSGGGDGSRDGGSSGLSGTYKLTSIKMGDSEISLEDFADTGEMPEISMEFTSDNKVLMRSEGEDPEETTYKLDGSTITVDSETGDPVEMKLDGDKIALELPDGTGTMILTKQ